MKRILFIAAVTLFFGLFAGTVYAETFTFPYAFTALNLNGTEVTEKSLGEKELFVVHYWATWCGPCVREMPDLAAIVQKYGDRVGFIALLDDYHDNRSAAIRITEKAGVSFAMVDARHKDFRKLLQMLQSGYVPTTVLIGKNGKIAGEQIIGAYGKGYGGFIDKALK
ncbi:MAG: TlpA family protein disulfide reductase [Treponema sp.]|jgi:thiol-disulfide isomerase/thioredoxin|nr:TlpA family protein disulfide reductase [Treponema sp.]